jgi:diguanylate cyclase (GGDEF)-like protein
MFEEYLVREINRASRYGTSFVLLLLDLRQFKIANDTYGHATGDKILRSVARACAETIRGSDLACRIGGDEFAILLPESERASAEALAERIARKFEAYAQSLAPDTSVGIDYGTALFPEDGEEATKLFQFADKNLYESKQRAYRLLQEPIATARAPASEAEARAREGSAGRDNGGRQSAFRSVISPNFGPAAERIPPSEHTPDRRQYERIPIEGARRLGVIRFGERCKAVKVLDLSLGGVCLLVDEGEVAERFSARIQVPFLPDAELTLHRIYCCELPDGKKRVGCSFAPVATPAAA